MMKHGMVAISGGDLVNATDRAGHSPEEYVDGFEPAAWYVGSWPEHVLTPRWNGDCAIAGPMTEAEARRDADCVYGERE